MVLLTSLATIQGSTRPPSQEQLQQSIDNGFRWLSNAMRRNGGVSHDLYGEPDLACTAITGLAFLSEGSTPTSGKYCAETLKILDAVLDLSVRRLNSGDSAINISLVQRKVGRNADLFFAAFFLSEVYGESGGDQPEIREVLRALISRIGNAQGPDGTWGDESWAPVLGTVMGWECLRSAHASGFEINASANLVSDALHRKLLQDQKGVQDDSWMHLFYKETASLRVLYSTPYRHEPIFDETVERLLEMVRKDKRLFQQAGGEEYLAMFLVSECLIKEPRPLWTEWQPLVSDQLIQLQNQDGSWNGHHCITDRSFCTAAALLTLLAPRLSLSVSDL